MKCAVNCSLNGIQYKCRECPLCLCTCDAFVEMEKYSIIVTITSLGQVKQEDSQKELIEFLGANLNVNRLQQQQSSKYYHQLSNSGGMTCNNSVINNIANEGALAQSLNMLANPLSQGVIRRLRTVVDGVQHLGCQLLSNYSVIIVIAVFWASDFGYCLFLKELS